MAKLTVQNESVEVTTSGYSMPDYEIVVNFYTPETEEGMVSSLTIPTTESSRSDMTFETVQRYIDETFEDSDLEVTEVASIRVNEVETIKSGWN